MRPCLKESRQAGRQAADWLEGRLVVYRLNRFTKTETESYLLRLGEVRNGDLCLMRTVCV